MIRAIASRARKKLGAPKRALSRMIYDRRAAIDMQAPVVFVVATQKQGFGGRGAVAPPLFFPVFEETLARRGCQLRFVKGLDELSRTLPRMQRAAFIIIWNSAYSSPEIERELVAMRAVLDERVEAPLIYNEPEARAALGDKVTGSEALQALGVPMPSRNCQTELVFSNARVGSQTAIQLLPRGQALPTDRYNTDFVNTAVPFRDKSYHVCLRAMIVDRRCVGVVVRARDIQEGNPSVHAKDTPRDPALLNHLYATLVLPKLEEIGKICAGVSGIGPGFYSCDILPCQDTGRLLVCEAGVKFFNATFGRRMAKLSEDLIFPTFMTPLQKSTIAHAFVASLADRGFDIPERPMSALGKSAMWWLQ